MKAAVYYEAGPPSVFRYEGVADPSLRVVIDRTYPLSEAAAAHASNESRQAFGRVLLIP